MKLILKVMCLLQFLMFATAGYTKADQVFEQIIVWVNNDIITLGEYDKSKDLLRKELQKSLKGQELERIYTQQEKEILKSMIDDQLLVQKGNDLGITVETEVIKYLDRIRRDFNV